MTIKEYLRYKVFSASKIKLKNANKKENGYNEKIFFFLKASITDLITLLSSSVQNSEGGSHSDSSDFQRPKFNLQPLSFTFETFDKKLPKTKIVARDTVKTI